MKLPQAWLRDAALALDRVNDAMITYPAKPDPDVVTAINELEASNRAIIQVLESYGRSLSYLDNKTGA